MDRSSELHIDEGIEWFDGYKEERIWSIPENYSTYYSEEIDKQCTVPIRNFEKIVSKIGI